jgi:L-seryl-tRNA(Ser) seleniumtransferase
MLKAYLQKIPAVDLLLNHPQIRILKETYTSEFITYCIRMELNRIRSKSQKATAIPDVDDIVNKIIEFIGDFSNASLKKVINATGIILHTNLGRAPLGEYILEEIRPAIIGYSNLEFDLKTAKRGKRIDHVIELLKFLTGAESAVIVNNNAAAVSLVLRAFCEGKETIISRGELIEIGDSFRLPEIMESSGTIMIEVGTTNRTRISDYKKAITKNTRLILKAHKSNYSIRGFTEETELKELAVLAKKYKLILTHDIGSGLVLNSLHPALADEPLVRKSFSSGADLVTFSCDKLLGGPQAGIIAGKKKLIDKVSQNPLMRTYRVDKITLAMLSAVLRAYIKKADRNNLPIFKLFKRSKEELKSLALKLVTEFEKHQIQAEIRESEAFSGGGSLPNVKLESYSVMLRLESNGKDYQRNLYKKLLQAETPILCILKKGEIHFDVLTVFEDDIPIIAKMVKSVI